GRVDDREQQKYHALGRIHRARRVRTPCDVQGVGAASRTTGRTRVRTRTRTVVALAAASLVGLGIGVGPHVFSSDAAASREFDTQHSVRTIHLPGHGHNLSAAELARRFENPRATTTPSAPDPRAAVQRFLDGEITRNDAQSYAQLS